MTTWQIILIPVGLMILGLIRQMLILRRKTQHLSLADEFLGKFVEWCNGEARDHSLYNWMLSKAVAIQTMLAGGGLIHYRPPFANYIHRNYPVILNEIPEIQKEFLDDLRSFNSIAAQNLNIRIQMVDGCLRRFMGSTEEEHRRERGRLFNPLVLFCGGIAWLMELPLFILSETKIITTNRRAIIVNGWLFSLASGILALAALVGTIITIVTGWERFVQIATGWMK
jgi:hypothetical protein